jgi:hypothetical protein
MQRPRDAWMSVKIQALFRMELALAPFTLSRVPFTSPTQPFSRFFEQTGLLNLHSDT